MGKLPNKLLLGVPNAAIAVSNEVIYSIPGKRKFNINWDNMTATESSITVNGTFAYNTFGITEDQEYIFQKISNSDVRSDYPLTLLKKTGEEEWTVLTGDSIPEKLKPYTESPCTSIWNPVNQTLTCCSVDSTVSKWDVFKYENGEFIQFNIDMNLDSTADWVMVSVSKDIDKLLATIKLPDIVTEDPNWPDAPPMVEEQYEARLYTLKNK